MNIREEESSARPTYDVMEKMNEKFVKTDALQFQNYQLHSQIVHCIVQMFTIFSLKTGLQKVICQMGAKILTGITEWFKIQVEEFCEYRINKLVERY